MTTINTIEDLIKLLDENPQWVEALRVRLLTRELIELPEKFAQFADETSQFIAEMKQFTAEMKQFTAETKQFTAETRQRLDRLEADVKGIRDDLGPLKGAHARNAAHNGAYFIATRFGFTFVRTLGSEELLPFIQGENAGGVPLNQLESFHQADLVMEARDHAGRDCYLAVEVSYTVDERDVGRAIRNAEFLTRFTERPAHAVAAGLRYDHRIRSNIESGEVLWYEMNNRSLEVE